MISSSCEKGGGPTPTIRKKNSRYEQAPNVAATQRDLMARKISSSPQKPVKVKSHLSACDVQRRKEHMHRLTSGIAITDRKVLNADVWTPGTDAYRLRFYENHQPQLQQETSPNVNTILGQTEPRNAFRHRKTLGLDKMARCKICEVEFLAARLTTTITFKRIYDLRAKWKRVAADTLHDEEEKRHEHQVAEQAAKDRAELLLATTKKAAELKSDDDGEQNSVVKKQSESLTLATKRAKSSQQRPDSSVEPVPFTPSVLYAPCRVCRFCSQYVGSYLDDQSPAAAAPIIRHKAYLPARNTQQSSFEKSTTNVFQSSQTTSQNKMMFPSSAQAILQICLQERAPKKAAVTSLSKSVGDESSTSHNNTGIGKGSTRHTPPLSMRNVTVCKRKSTTPTSDAQKCVPVAYPLSPPSRLKPLARPMCVGDSDFEDDADEDSNSEIENSRPSVTTASVE